MQQLFVEIKEYELNRKQLCKNNFALEGHQRPDLSPFCCGLSNHGVVGITVCQVLSA